jgi:hypothetical protein
MEQHDEELIRILLPSHADLKAAYEEHGKLKQRVDDLRSQPYLSPAEEVEKKNLQKRKLAEKDRIMAILAEHRKTQVASSAV